MTRVLVRKLLVDLRVGLVTVCMLLFLFQLLWSHVCRRIVGEILQSIVGFIPLEELRGVLFRGSGQIVETIMGGQDIRINQAGDLMSISYVHPLTLIILCIWAVGRSSGAIAGEIDRGTMELLLAQPIRRSQVILAHLLVDLLTIPLLCAAVWSGTWFGTWIIGLQDNPSANLRVDPYRFWPGLLCMFALTFAVSGYTMWLSARGRFRHRVLGWAILLTLAQFIINIAGQMFESVDWLRQATVFYHYQPQPLILKDDWAENPTTWEHLGVLLALGVVGYLLGWWKFCKRDLPAPL